MSSLGFYNTNLPPHLRVLKDEIEGYARGYGLDFYETIFEVIDADDLNEIAAYGGFPTRYPHWSFGMQYEELKKGYEYGLSKIYEMVINNDPCYAYLMRCNHTVDQKLVMAHVYGHCDFFKNNAYFGHTTRKMMDEIANHAARIRGHVERYGEDEVEAFVDKCMSIDDLIDIHSVAIKRRDEPSKYDFTPAATQDAAEEDHRQRFRAKAYMADYINPPGQMKADEDERKKATTRREARFPERPEKDVLLFLIEHAPLKNWQRDILSIVRDEAYYFYPQAQTKVLNEGWACLVEGSWVVTDHGFLRIEDIVRERSTVRVSDGAISQQVYDWARFEERETVRVRTRRGLEVEGSLTHRLQQKDGNWVALADVAPGVRVKLARGANQWAVEPVRTDWHPHRRRTLAEFATTAGVPRWVLDDLRRGREVRGREQLLPLVAEYERELKELPTVFRHRKTISVPAVVDEKFAAFLGYLTGDGHISAKKRTMGLTTGDEPQADHFAELVTECSTSNRGRSGTRPNGASFSRRATCKTSSCRSG